MTILVCDGHCTDCNVIRYLQFYMHNDIPIGPFSQLGGLTQLTQNALHSLSNISDIRCEDTFCCYSTSKQLQMHSLTQEVVHLLYMYVTALSINSGK